MAVKRRGLGKGLGALLANSPATTLAIATNIKQEYLYLNISNIVPGKFQPRRNFRAEELQELAESIRSQGILQPLVVRKTVDDTYEIVAGERRWRAAQLAELQKIPVIVKDIDDKATAAIAIIENMQREDLNALEEAIAISRLVSEFDLTHLEVAKLVGKSRTAISNLLRVLNLNTDVQDLLKDNKIELGHAKVLLAIAGSAQSEIAKVVVAGGLSVRATEKLISASGKEVAKVNGVVKPVAIDPDILRLQQKLSDFLGARVLVQHSGSGKGKLVINYNNVDELDGILEKITG
ncbi:MAG: chromosome partitioning protein ParB [Legionellales bacterium]|nr:MAG: chromosome partitioning protein ParB [Legionellales bacterium]